MLALPHFPSPAAFPRPHARGAAKRPRSTLDNRHQPVTICVLHDDVIKRLHAACASRCACHSLCSSITLSTCFLCGQTPHIQQRQPPANVFNLYINRMMLPATATTVHSLQQHHDLHMLACSYTHHSRRQRSVINGLHAVRCSLQCLPAAGPVTPAPAASRCSRAWCGEV